MIVGTGDIAGALAKFDLPDWLYFASGVSNSQETDEAAYRREIRLLRAQPKGYHVVYFSSLSVFYSDSRYARHKRHVELLLKELHEFWTIVRIGNITWGDNPHTLINYLKAHPEAEIQDVERYILDLDEFQHWMERLPSFCCEVNVPGRRMKVQEVVEEFVRTPCLI